MTKREWLEIAYGVVIAEFGEGMLNESFKLELCEEYEPHISPELGVLRTLRRIYPSDHMLFTLERAVNARKIQRMFGLGEDQEIISPSVMDEP